MSELIVEYHCDRCGPHKIELPYRRGDEDVVRWMKDVVEVAISADHAKRICGALSCDIKIPHDKSAEWIGGPPVH